MAVYTKNYYLKGFGCIGGLEVSAEIDRALNAALSKANKKASEYHSEAPKKKATPKKKAE